MFLTGPTLCRVCSQWGNSEFRSRQGAPVCAICAGNHLAERHKCEVATYGRTGKVCAHTAIKCTNCIGNHRAFDSRCRAKGAAIALGGRTAPAPRGRTEKPERRRALSPPCIIEDIGKTGLTDRSCVAPGSDR